MNHKVFFCFLFCLVFVSSFSVPVLAGLSDAKLYDEATPGVHPGTEVNQTYDGLANCQLYSDGAGTNWGIEIAYSNVCDDFCSSGCYELLPAFWVCDTPYNLCAAYRVGENFTQASSCAGASFETGWGVAGAGYAYTTTSDSTSGSSPYPGQLYAVLSDDGTVSSDDLFYLINASNNKGWLKGDAPGASPDFLHSYNLSVYVNNLTKFVNVTVDAAYRDEGSVVGFSSACNNDEFMMHIGLSTSPLMDFNYTSTNQSGNFVSSTIKNPEEIAQLSFPTAGQTYYVFINGIYEALVTTVIVDTTAPTINLSYPFNNTANTTSNTIDLWYNATDNADLASCSLYINNTLNTTTTDTTPGLFNNFTIPLNNGAYSWFVNCSDAAGNYNISDTWIFNVAVNQPPVISNLQCYNSTAWNSCGNLVYNNSITQVRANCTDPNNNVLNISFRLTNVFDSAQFYFLNASTKSGITHTLDHSDIIINESGTWNLSATCFDNLTLSDSNYTEFFIPWGTLNSTLLWPNETMNITQLSFFDFNTSVQCLYGECGNVSAYLDPKTFTKIEPEEIKLSWLETLWLYLRFFFHSSVTGFAGGSLVNTSHNATPWYTNTSNPLNDICLRDLRAGDVCEQTWRVNASGGSGTTSEFFAIFNSSTNPIAQNTTKKVNLTIEGFPDTIPPNVTLIPIAKNSSLSAVTLNCSVIDNVNIQNVSLYGNWSTWTVNQTNSSGINPSNYSFNVDLADGDYMWNCRACDQLNNCNFSVTNATLTVDTSVPIINFVDPTPASGALLSANYTLVNVSCVDAHTQQAWVNFSSNISTLINTATIYYSRNISNLSDGLHEYQAFCNDTFGNVNKTEFRTVLIDTTPPIFSNFFCQPDPANVTQSVTCFVNVTDLSTDVVYANLSSPANFLASQPTTSNTSITYQFTYTLTNVTGLYNVTWFANDSFGRLTTFQTNFTVLDPNPPIIQIFAPINNEIIGWNISLSANASDPLLDSVWYEIRNSTDVLNSSFLFGPDFDSYWMTNDSWPYNATLLTHANFTFIVFANDSSGNLANRSINFTLDNSKPGLQILTPLNASAYNVNFSMSVVMSNFLLNYSNYSIRNSTGQIIQFNSSGLSSSSGSWSDIVGVSNFPDGLYNLTVYVRDLVGNNVTKSVLFSVDTSVPEILFELPTQPSGTLQGFNYTLINVSCVDANTAQAWVNFSTNISTLANTATIYYSANITNLSDGLHEYQAFCNDTLGNINATEVRTLTIDTTPPIFSNFFCQPDPANVTQSVTCFVNVTDLSTDIVYSNLSSPANFLATQPTVTNTSVTYQFTYTLTNVTGLFNVTWFANDSFGRLATFQTNFTVLDPNPPVINILAPINNGLVAWNVTLSANATDILLDSVWYEIRNGTDVLNTTLFLPANFTAFWMTNATWPYNTSLLTHANFTFIVFANDSSGNIANRSVNFTLDNSKPGLQILTPLNASIYSANFSMNVIMSNFLLNYSNYTIMNSTGQIVQFNSSGLSGSSEFWSDVIGVSTFPDGLYNLTVYVKDFTGNSVTKSVLFIVDTSFPVIQFEFPTKSSGTIQNFNHTIINVSCVDDNVDSVWINWSSLLLNFSVINPPSYLGNFTEADGLHLYQAFCNDSLNNIAQTEFRNITFDTIAPLIANISFNNNITVYNAGSAENVSVNFTSSEYPINITFYLYNSTGDLINTSGPFIIDNASNLPINYLIPDNLADGNYTLNLTIIDLASNEETAILDLFFVDTIPPIISNITFNNNLTAYNNGSTENVPVNFTLDDYSVNLTFYLYNSTGDLVDTFGPIVITNSSDIPLNYTIPGGLPDGNYTLNLSLVDLAGNEESAILGLIVVDSTAPLITSPLLDGGDIVYNDGTAENVSVNFTSSEYPINITFYLYNSTGDLINTSGPFIITNASSLPVNYSIPGGLPDGNYTLNMTVIDLSNNEIEAVLGTIIVDTIAPVITSPTLDGGPIVYNDGTAENVSVNFTSSEYPINITFTLYNISGDLIDTFGPIILTNVSDLPINYSIPGGLLDGNYTLNLTVIDLAGNEDTTTLGTIIVDTIPPIISNITFNNNLTVYNNGSSENVLVNFTLDDYTVNLTFYLYNSTGDLVDTFGPIVITNSSDIPLNYTIPSGLLDGNYTLNLTLIDLAGNTNTTTIGTIVIDATNPTITSPTLDGGDIVYNNGSAENISVNFTSSEYPINITFYLYNSTGDLINTSGPFIITNASSLPINYSIPGNLLDGNYTLNMTVIDLAGNKDTATLGTIIVDSVAPVISSPLLDGGDIVYNDGTAENVSVNFTSSEYPINITFNLYNISGDLIDTFGPIILTNASDLPIDYSIPGGLLDGNYTLNMTVIDLAGNEDTTTLGTIIVDTIAPAITSPTLDGGDIVYNNGTSENVAVNFTSDEFPINLTFYLYNSTGDLINTSGPFTIINSSDIPLNYTIPGGLLDGNYTLNLTVIDLAGNTNTTILGTIIVDSTAPLITSPLLDGGDIVYNDGSAENISVNFTSSEYPINITFNLYNISGDLIDTFGPITITNASSLPVNYSIPGGLLDGNYTLNMTVIDDSGNEDTVTLGTIIVDTIAPVITSPLLDGGDIVYNDGFAQNVSVNFTSSEYPINITFNLYNITGDLVDTFGPIILNSSTDLPLDYSIPSGLLDGNYTLNMTVIDPAGNENTTTIGTIIVDTTAPSITNPTLDGGDIVYNNGTSENILVNFTSDEYPINLTFDLYNISGDLVDTFGPIILTNSSHLPINYTIPGGLLDGNYTLNLTIIDVAGNENTTTIGTIIVDSTPPIVSNSTLNFGLPVITDGTAQNVSVNFTSDEFPINVTFDLFNETGDITSTQGPFLITNTSTLPLNFSLPGALPDGIYVLNMTVVDKLGNTVTITLGNITIDTTAPLITNVYCVPNQSLTFVPVTCFANISDLSLDNVIAKLFKPDNISLIMNWSKNGEIFNFAFNFTNVTGIYNVSWFVNDTANRNASADTFFNVTGSAICGNGVIEGFEACDTNDFGGETCVSQGFNSGTLSCTGACLIDTTNCDAGGGGGGGGGAPPVTAPPSAAPPTDTTPPPGPPETPTAPPITGVPVVEVPAETPAHDVCYALSVDGKSVDMMEVGYEGVLPLPVGFEQVIPPFSFDCAQPSFTTTISVPDNFDDLRVLKCRDGVCEEVNSVFDGLDLFCGEGLMKDEFRKNLKERRNVTSVDELTEFVDTVLTTEQRTISTSEYALNFGDSGEEVGLRVTLPDELVWPRNPTLHLLGKPLQLNLDTSATSLPLAIAMPYEDIFGLQEDGFGIYAYVRGEWHYLGSNLDTESMRVSVSVDNILDYAQDGKVVLAVIGIECTNCFGSELKLAYDGGSRNALILLHGLFSNPETFESMIKEFEFNKAPWQVWTFGYPYDEDIMINSREFANALELNKDKFDYTIIAGHSLGGIIAQQALLMGYMDNLASPGSYEFVDRIKKAIIIGAPNEGSPLADVYVNLFGFLSNNEDIARLFSLESSTLEFLAKGIITERVTGIDYFTMAGTKTYEFNAGFFTIRIGDLLNLETNDGVLTVRSAQRLGDQYFDEVCVNYWAFPDTHTELTSDTLVENRISKIANKKFALEDPGADLMGYNQYLRIGVDQCSVEDVYVVIGRRIAEEAVFDALGCNCGNGFCGVGETENSCPEDCRLPVFCPLVTSTFVALLVFLLSTALLTIVTCYRKDIKKKYALLTLVALTASSAAFVYEYVGCEVLTWNVFVFVSIVSSLITLALFAIVFRRLFEDLVLFVRLLKAHAGIKFGKHLEADVYRLKKVEPQWLKINHRLCSQCGLHRKMYHMYYSLKATLADYYAVAAVENDEPAKHIEYRRDAEKFAQFAEMYKHAFHRVAKIDKRIKKI